MRNLNSSSNVHLIDKRVSTFCDMYINKKSRQPDSMTDLGDFNAAKNFIKDYFIFFILILYLFYMMCLLFYILNISQ